MDDPAVRTERNRRAALRRGSADDKAGIAAHLAAIRAYEGRPPVGVTVLVEGEEEIGSPNLGAFLDRHRDRLAADAIVPADSENFAVGVPAFTTTLRGLAAGVVAVLASASVSELHARRGLVVALVVLNLVTAVVTTQRVSSYWVKQLTPKVSLKAAGLKPHDRVAMSYSGMGWRIWVSQAFQAWAAWRRS